MSLWSKLAKIGGYAAAPWTGGASIAVGEAVSKALGKAGPAAGAASQTAAGNRGTKAELMMDAQSDLERKLLAREAEKRTAQSDAYKKSMYAANALQWRPTARPAGVPRFSFTSGPGPLGRQAAQSLYTQAMQRSKAPDLSRPTGMPAYKNLMSDPAFKKTLTPSLWERILGIASVAAPVLGGLVKKGKDGGDTIDTLSNGGK